MRVGLFGGTFNPIHKGHLMVAEQALQRLALDRLYIIPCRVPPHKFPAYLAPAADRIRMIQLALPDDSRYRLSEVEIERDGPSYTIDTVAHFTSRVVPGAAVFLVMGMDSFLDIHTWKRHGRLLATVQPVVVTRRPDKVTDAPDAVLQLDRYIRSQLSDDYVFDRQQKCWHRADGQRIQLLSVTPVDISSSQVRQRVGMGKAIAGLVHPAVSGYIEEKELYR
jgi:nicotinate-nucleotide adenylyltransferase